MHQTSDGDIIQMVLQGNTRAYAVLVNRYSSYVYTLALRVLGNEADAEEAAQDVFIKAYNSLQGYNGQGKFSTWLYTVTRNTCLSRTRGNRQTTIHKEEHQLADLAGHSNNTIDRLEHTARKAVINKALQLLPADEAEIITLFYIHEQSIDEICTILNINNSNAKVKLHRARKRMKDLLDKHFSNDVTEYYKSS